MYRCLLLLWLLLGYVSAVRAQKADTTVAKNKTDSAVLKHDSVTHKRFVPKPASNKDNKYHPDSTHSPHKAVMHSLMVPGWGQLYNHQWWKVPVIYAGLGLLADAILFNQHYYSIYLKEAQLRERGITVGRNPDLAPYQDADIVSASEASRRNRDLSILGFVGGWGIQMIDAYIDAKFQHSYTMDNNLSFKISPEVMNQPTMALNSNGSYIPALKITFTLK